MYKTPIGNENSPISMQCKHVAIPLKISQEVFAMPIYNVLGLRHIVRL